MATKSDVLIIGGGPVGLSCAYYLLKSGRKVTILDANEIGKGSGSGNAGHVVPSLHHSAGGTGGGDLRT